MTLMFFFSMGVFNNYVKKPRVHPSYCSSIKPHCRICPELPLVALADCLEENS